MNFYYKEEYSSIFFRGKCYLKFAGKNISETQVISLRVLDQQSN